MDNTMLGWIAYNDYIEECIERERRGEEYSGLFDLTEEDKEYIQNSAYDRS